MKINKMITIDIELASSLERINLNVSQYCNEKLWDYITEYDNKVKDVNDLSRDIQSEIKELEEKNIEIKKELDLKQKREEAGITDEHIKFLKSMSTNIMAAKDMKLAYFNKFGQDIQWAELINLKSIWT